MLVKLQKHPTISVPVVDGKEFKCGEPPQTNDSCSIGLALMVEVFLITREVYGSTVGEHVGWKSEWIKEDTREVREGNIVGAEAAFCVQIYGEDAKSRQSARQGPRTEETTGTEEPEEPEAQRRGRMER